MQRAISFLGSKRNSSGLWTDFELEGGSDEWVTAVVGAALAKSGNKEAFVWCREAWQSFGARNLFNGHGGWGYNATCPEDADSTSWGIRFGTRLGLTDSGRVKLAVKALSEYITEEGGLTTYIHDEEIRRFICIHGAILTGWKITHTCNTAVGATLPQMNRLLSPYLAQKQLPSGNWDSYWFPDTVYPTAFAMEALLRNDPEKNRAAVNRAAGWILNKAGTKPYLSNRFLPKGSPFATAMGLKGLLLADPCVESCAKAKEFAGWLIENQREDGSWEPSVFLLRIPPAHTASFRDESPDEFPERWTGRIYPDIHSVMTTAFVLESLLMIQSAFSDQNDKGCTTTEFRGVCTEEKWTD